MNEQATPNPEWQAMVEQIKAATARKPAQARKPKTVTANELTRQIVSHIRANGFFATRLNSTGLYREDLKRFVKSQQITGLGDILAIAKGSFAFFVEIKIGRDSLSIAQKEAITALQIVDTPVWVVGSFDEFLRLFNGRFTPFNEADALPFGPTSNSDV